MGSKFPFGATPPSRAKALVVPRLREMALPPPSPTCPLVVPEAAPLQIFMILRASYRLVSVVRLHLQSENKDFLKSPKSS